MQQQQQPGSLAFCPSGKYLAYSTSTGEIVREGTSHDDAKRVVLTSKCVSPGTLTIENKRGKALENAGQETVCSFVLRE